MHSFGREVRPVSQLGIYLAFRENEQSSIYLRSGWERVFIIPSIFLYGHGLYI